MSRPTRRRSARLRTGRALLLAVAALLTCAGLAFAAVGLQNPSFEDGLTGWSATTVKDEAYPADATCVDRRGVCLIDGSDTFTVNGTPLSVAPLDGTKMVRLGGPFESASQDQPLDRYKLSQSFVVDPANPVLKLNYNVFTFDYLGFDELRLTVKLVDSSGSEITQFAQGAFGSGTSLKNTGWQAAHIDLTGYENQTVFLEIDSGGTSDRLYAFWAYVDAGEVAASPVGDTGFGTPPLPGGGEVDEDVFTDESTGQSWINIPNSDVGQFPNGCMPLTVNVPIDPGAGTTSNVKLIATGDSDTDVLSMLDADGDGTWTATLPCAFTASLLVQYDLTEEGTTQTFLIPIGGITLVDPAGVIYDAAQYDAAIAQGKTPDEARAAAAITGAKVRLQRKQDDGSFANVLSGDPGISPKVNPQTTGAEGRFAWLTSDGTYRVVVSKDGYPVTVSREVTVPPEVTDLHVAMGATTETVPPDDDGDGVPNSSDQCPSVAAATASGCPASTTTTTTTTTGPPTTTPPTAGPKKGPCEGLLGTKLALCRIEQNRLKQVAKCNAKPKAKRAACVKKANLAAKKAKALQKCKSLKGKKKAKCVAKAKKIGQTRKRS